MGVPMQSRDYALIGAFLFMTLIGFGLLATRFRSLFPLHSAQRIGFWLLSLALLATLVNYLGYNLTFVQFQGRYLYTALIPAGVLITGGWVGWSLQLRVWAGERWQRPLTWIPLAALVWMPGLSLWALDRYIIPYL
jgi:hypothetical protein